MRIIRGVIVAVLIALVGVGLEAQQPSPDQAEESQLRRTARERDVTLSINNGYEPVTFDRLVKETDTVVIGKILLGRAFLQGEWIHTDYEVAVEEVIRRTHPPGIAPGDVLVVRRAGGAFTVDGHNVVGKEEDFPPLVPQDRYVFFLTPSKFDQPFYWVAWGPQGAFTVRNGTVRQVSEVFGSWNRERGSNVPIETFANEVRAMAQAR